MVHAMALRGMAWHLLGSDSDLDPDFFGKIIQDTKIVCVLLFVLTFVNESEIQTYKYGNSGN